MPPRNEPLLYISSAADDYQQLPLKVLYLCYHRSMSKYSTLNNPASNRQCIYRFICCSGMAHFSPLIPEGLT